MVQMKNDIQQCQALCRAGKYNEARVLAESALASGGDPWSGYNALGNIHLATESLEDAVEAHTSALAHAPDARSTAISWNNLGVAFLNASAFDVAIECFGRIIESRALSAARPPYLTEMNIALCHLHVGNITEGLAHAREAFELESPAIVTANLSAPVILRNVFIQLALQSNHVTRVEIEQRAHEAQAHHLASPDVRTELLVAIINACIDVAYHDRARGLDKLNRTLVSARQHPSILMDTLLALVQAEKLSGRTSQAIAHLNEWLRHTFPDLPKAAAALRIKRWMGTGEVVREQLHELIGAVPMPPALATLLCR